MSKRDENHLIALLRKHDTPTDVIAEAFVATRCDLILHYEKKEIVVKGKR